MQSLSDCSRCAAGARLNAAPPRVRARRQTLTVHISTYTHNSRVLPLSGEPRKCVRKMHLPPYFHSLVAAREVLEASEPRTAPPAVEAGLMGGKWRHLSRLAEGKWLSSLC